MRTRCPTWMAFLAVALIMLAVMGQADAQCKKTNTPLWGKVCPQGKSLCVDSGLAASGPIKGIKAYYHFSYDCIQGITVTYANTKTLTNQRSYTLGSDRKLIPDQGKEVCKRCTWIGFSMMHEEVISGVELIVGDTPGYPSCIEYLKFKTSFGNEMAVGNAGASGTKRAASAPKGGYLSGIRATEYAFGRTTGTGCIAPMPEMLYQGFNSPNCKATIDDCPVIQQLGFTWTTCA